MSLTGCASYCRSRAVAAVDWVRAGPTTLFSRSPSKNGFVLERVVRLRMVTSGLSVHRHGGGAAVALGADRESQSCRAAVQVDSESARSGILLDTVVDGAGVVLHRPPFGYGGARWVTWELGISEGRPFL
jgi:hypothetical protein